MVTGCSAALQGVSFAAPPAEAVAVSGTAMELVKNGHSRYVIALADDAIPAEVTAAGWVSEYIEKMSGAKLAVRKESEVPQRVPQILVGAGTRVKQLLPEQDWSALGTEGIVVKTVGKNLVLAGGRPRGSLYAVNTFLEDTLYVRWWNADETFIPKNKTIRFGALNTVYTPSIKIREAFYTSVMRDPVFAVHMRNNGDHQKQTDELGSHSTILGWVHTFDKFLPPEKYFKDHPEWYSDVNNGNKPCTSASVMPASQNSQICLTNEEARKEFTKNALELIRTNPGAGIISISQNDNRNRCMADADLAIEQEEGSPSGPLLKFVNAVAADIEKEFPGFLVETLAYQYTRKPPLHERPRKNVVIRLCSIETDFARPLNSFANNTFRDDVLGWKAIAPRLYIWDYVTNFRSSVFPHPNLRVLGPNVRFFSENNTIGLFEQGDAYSNGTGDFVALRVWLLSHLMWNPKLDQTKLENEFLEGYYGEAAPFLRIYLNELQDQFLKSGGPLSTFQLNHSYLTRPFLQRASGLFQQAAAAVAGDPVLTRRVRRERLALDHAWLVRYNALLREAAVNGEKWDGPTDMAVAATDFVRTAEEFKTENHNEQTPFAENATGLLARFTQPVKAAAVAAGKPVQDVIDIQDSEIRLPWNPWKAQRVQDPKASDGWTTWTVGDSTAWFIQFPITETDAVLNKGKWHCYVYARVEPKPDAKPGAVVTLGVGNLTRKNFVGVADKNLDELADGEYHALDLGVVPLKTGLTFGVQSKGRSDIAKIFVDRFVFVREDG